MEDEAIEWRNALAPTRECPVLLAREATDLFLAFSMFEKGLLPDPGTWTQQSNYWIQAFRVIGASVSEQHRVRREALQREAEQD